MIPRRAQTAVQHALARQAAVALTGPRQVGKTTLAHAIAAETPSVYLDLEASEDRAKLADPAAFLSRYEDRLVVLDEIHRVPELFSALRGLIDRGRRHGRETSRFLILGRNRPRHQHALDSRGISRELPCLQRRGQPGVAQGFHPHLPGARRNPAQAASRSTRTRQPTAVAMLTSASSEKRETRPRSRSLIRGCVTPQRLAASACVQPCFFRRAPIFCISSARALRFAASSGVSAIASQTLA